MTKKEAVVIETFTGICMLEGNDRNLAYQYAEELLGYPVMTHDFANRELMSRLKELSKPDFIEICKNLTSD